MGEAALKETANARRLLLAPQADLAVIARYGDTPKWIDRLLQQSFATLPTINKPSTGTRFSLPFRG